MKAIYKIAGEIAVTIQAEGTPEELKALTEMFIRASMPPIMFKATADKEGVKA